MWDIIGILQQLMVAGLSWLPFFVFEQIGNKFLCHSLRQLDPKKFALALVIV